MKTFSDQCLLDAPVHEVARAIMSADYLEYRYRNEGAGNYSIEIHDHPESLFAYRLRRVINLGDRVPRIARGLVGTSLILIQTARWTDQGENYLGSFTLSEERFSGGVDIEVLLRAESQHQSVLSFKGELRVNVPLIGKQIEKLMADRVSDTFSESITAIEEYMQQLNG